MPEKKYTAEFKIKVILTIVQGGIKSSMPFVPTST